MTNNLQMGVIQATSSILNSEAPVISLERQKLDASNFVCR